MERTTRLVWDLPVRVTHWLLVISVSGAYLTSRFGTRMFKWHRYCGYTVLILVTFRIVWGLVGTRHARFENFLRSPRHAIEYLWKLRSTSVSLASVGHNPLGGWSVVAMLALLIAQAGTGLFANDDIISTGPFFGWVSHALSNALTMYHHVIFNALEALLGAHVLMIAFYGYVRKVNLLTPMVTGCKPAALVAEPEEIHGSRVFLALGIIAVLGGALAAALFFAPAASLSI